MRLALRVVCHFGLNFVAAVGQYIDHHIARGNNPIEVDDIVLVELLDQFVEHISAVHTFNNAGDAVSVQVVGCMLGMRKGRASASAWHAARHGTLQGMAAQCEHGDTLQGMAAWCEHAARHGTLQGMTVWYEHDDTLQARWRGTRGKALEAHRPNEIGTKPYFLEERNFLVARLQDSLGGTTDNR